MSFVKGVVGFWIVFLALCVTVLVGSATYEQVFGRQTYRVVQRLEGLPPFVTTDITTNAEDKFPALIRLHENDNGEQDRFFCSAFVVSDTYAITAAHCLADDANAMKKNAILVHELGDGNSKYKLEAVAVALNHVSDLGLIKGDFKKFNKLPVDPKPQGAFNVNGPVITCGFPYGDTDLCTRFVPQGPNYEFIMGQGFIYPGMSGGPVLDAVSGFVIGVNSSISGGFVNIAPLIGLFSDAGVKIK